MTIRIDDITIQIDELTIKFNETTMKINDLAINIDEITIRIGVAALMCFAMDTVFWCPGQLPCLRLLLQWFQGRSPSPGNPTSLVHLHLPGVPERCVRTL